MMKILTNDIDDKVWQRCAHHSSRIPTNSRHMIQNSEFGVVMNNFVGVRETIVTEIYNHR